MLFSKKRRRNKQARREPLFRPQMERLQARLLMAGDAFQWDDVTDVLNDGRELVRSQAAQLAAEAVGLDLPIVEQSIDQALDLASKLQQPFETYIDPAVGFDQLRDQLAAAGFTVEQLSTSPDDNGNLVRLSRDIRWTSQTTTFGVGGDVGFDYFDDNVRGQLSGSLQATAPEITLHVVFGVDLQAGNLSFYVDEASYLAVDNLAGSAHVEGELGIRQLLHVVAEGDLELRADARIDFVDSDSDHKLRAADLVGSAAYDATINGHIQLVGGFTSDVPLLPDIQWSGTWRADLVDGQVENSESLVAPNADGVLESLAGSLFTAKSGFNPLEHIAGKLQTKLPLIDKSISELAGVERELGWLTTAVSTSDPLAALAKHGIQVNVTPTTVEQMIRGEQVELLSFQKGGTVPFFEAGGSIDILSLGIPKVAAVSLGAYVETFGQMQYHVGFGIDTTGFYVDPNTSVSIQGGAGGGIEGKVEVIGFKVASARGGLRVSANVGLRIHDPDPSDGKVYLDEIFREGEDLATSFSQAIDAYASVDLQAHVKAKVLFWTVFSKNWTLASFGSPVNHRPEITETKRQFPLGNTTALEVPANLESDGTLLLNGTGNMDLVKLSRSTNGVTVDWTGRGSVEFNGVQRVRFLGGDGDDILTVAPGFDLPIYADGGAGNDRLEGGTAEDILLGGAGDDTLTGRDGNDYLDGGDGNDVLYGGAGDDVLEGADGLDTMFGESGADSLDGGRDKDYLSGGAGDDSLYGGDGDDTLHGDSGDDSLFGGRDDDVLYGDAGDDRLLGEDHDDELVGGPGNDVLEGGYGDDLQHGGEGDDHLLGGDGDDVLFGGLHDDQLDGQYGDDELNGDQGDDQLFGREGNDQLRGGSGNDRLEGGRDNDRLHGGEGLDVLMGESGNDLFEVDFASTDGSVVDQIVGGVDYDTVTIRGTENDDHILLDQLGTTQFRATDLDTTTAAVQGVFTFDTSDDVESLALEGLQGDDRLEVASTFGRNLRISGGRGNDTLIGGRGRDTLEGGEGDDTIYGGEGDDYLRGGNGDDHLDGGIGNDELHGNNGNDVLLGGGGGFELMFGGDDNDHLEAGDGPEGDDLEGGRGNDTLIGGEGDDVLDGEDGHDVISGLAGDDVILGGDGDDVLKGGIGYDTLIGGDDNDELWANGSSTPEPLSQTGEQQYKRDRLKGQDGDDQLHGSRRADLLSGGDDDDTIFHSEGDDIVVGGEGRDTYRLDGTEQDDVLQVVAAVDSDGNHHVQVFDQGLLQTELELRPPTSVSSDFEQLETDLEVLRFDLAGGHDQLDVDLGSLALIELEVHAGSGNDVVDARTLQARTWLYGGPGQDTLHGGDSDDVLEGGSDPDHLFGNGGEDTIDGGSGDDTIDGGSENDTIHGRSGRDVIFGRLGDDKLYGDEDDDTIYGGDGDDYIVGGDEVDRKIELYDYNDRLYGEGGNDTIYGGRGRDMLSGGDNDTNSGSKYGDHLYGEGGNDDLFGGPGNDYLSGGDETAADGLLYGWYNDRLYGDDGSDFMVGGAGHDYLVAGNGGDSVENDGYADHMYGESGNDYIIGGPDRDYISGGDEAGTPFNPGGSFHDQLYGEGGDDYIQAGSGVDYVVGGAGNDTLLGDAGDDWLYGNDGDDDVRGGTGNDRIYGNNGNDLLVGDYHINGDDANTENWMYGGEGDDRFEGSAGRDWMYGEEGADLLIGYGGSDYLRGGSGDDILKGDGRTNSHLQSYRDASDYFYGDDGWDYYFDMIWDYDVSDIDWNHWVQVGRYK